MRFLAAYIMKDRIHAIFVVSVLSVLTTYFPPISVVSLAAVSLVTLRLGAKEGLYVLLSGCVAAALVSLLQFGTYLLAVSWLVLWMPIWMISLILREGRQLLLAIEIALGLGVAGIVMFFLYQPDPAVFWRDLILAQQNLPSELVQQMADVFAYLMTGGYATGMVTMLLLGLFLARSWQAMLYNPGGFRMEFLALKARPALAWITLLIIMLLGLTSGTTKELSANVMILLFMFYAIIGTSVLHSTFANKSGAWLMVPFLYVTELLIPHVMVLVALWGFADTWLNLRNKLKPNGADKP